MEIKQAWLMFFLFFFPGTSEGTVLVFSVSEDGSKIDMVKQLQRHTAPISDLAAYKMQLLSSDSQGTIVLWQGIATSSKPALTIDDSR